MDTQIQSIGVSITPELLSDHSVKNFPFLSNSLWPYGLYSPWNSPGQNTGVGSCPLLQGVFPRQKLKGSPLHCRQILYQLSCQGNPYIEVLLCAAVGTSKWEMLRLPPVSISASWMQISQGLSQEELRHQMESYCWGKCFYFTYPES